MPPHPRQPRPKPSPTRRGSVYLLVLGVASIVLVIGLGVVGTSTANLRTTNAARDWSAAGIAARSGIECAIATLNADDNWRHDCTSGVPSPAITIGSAKVRVTLVDEVDGNLAASTNRPVRVYATAWVGSAVRVYSALLVPLTSGALDVLRCAVYSPANVSCTGTTTVNSGPISAGNTVSNSGTLTSNVETVYLSNTGTILGVTSGMAPKVMPLSTGSGSAYDTLKAQATPINVGLLGSTISKVVLSATNNPYGSANAAGVYSIDVPLLTTLVIKQCRIQATLIINLTATSTLKIGDQVLWDPPTPSQPALIVNTSGLSTVNFVGNTTSNTLSEPALGVNFNPPGTPYQGTSNTTTTDTFPAELHGVYHILGSGANINLSSNFATVGCIISESALSIASCSLASDPNLMTTPPAGYQRPAGGILIAQPGSYQWKAYDSSICGTKP